MEKIWNSSTQCPSMICVSSSKSEGTKSRYTAIQTEFEIFFVNKCFDLFQLLLRVSFLCSYLVVVSTHKNIQIQKASKCLWGKNIVTVTQQNFKFVFHRRRRFFFSLSFIFSLSKFFSDNADPPKSGRSTVVLSIRNYSLPSVIVGLNNFLQKSIRTLVDISF